MKNLSCTVVLILSLMLGAFAQELPIRSPRGGVYQKVGLTNITADYSRPSVKGRTIFGDLIQYGDLWRAGANQATTITSDTEFKIGDQTIPAGKYALFIIPNESEWTFILNKNNGTWGATGYDKSIDVARISVPVKNSDFRETLTIEISDVTDKTLGITVLWEMKSATLPITVEYQKQALVNIATELNSINDLYRKYNSIATYYLENDPQPKKALEYAKKSCELDAKFFNLKVLSLAYAANGDYKNAIKSAEESLEKAEKVGNRAYINTNTQNIKIWKKLK